MSTTAVKHAPPPHSAQPKRSCLLSSRKEEEEAILLVDDDEKTLKHANIKRKRIPSSNSLEVDSSSSSSPSKRGITVIHKEQLPSFSCERFFLLSELQVHAAQFWQQQQQDDDDSNNNEHDISSDNNKSHQKRTSSFWCLYLFWRPNDLQCITPNDYIQNVIRPVLRELNSQHVFLVVDRLVLEEEEEDDDNNNNNTTTQQTTTTAFEEAERAAETLVQTVAKELRDQLQGITVGLSNHKRAAPGLEVCCQIVTYGAGERRQRQYAAAKSLIGLACQHADDDLLGHDPHPQETDAVQNVHQVRISAEWKGSFQEFAHRAHAVWLKNHHRHHHPERKQSGIDEEDMVNLAVVILLVMYLLFHTRSWWLDFVFSS